MRDRRHVDDVGDLVADVVERTHGGLTTRAGALDAHFQRLQAVVERGLAGLLGRDLGCERGRLAGAAEARAAQESALPWRSVIVMIVLLKDACTWAMPSVTTRLIFFRVLAAGFAMAIPYFLIGLRGPLRVRALVRVR